MLWKQTLLDHDCNRITTSVLQCGSRVSAQKLGTSIIIITCYLSTDSTPFIILQIHKGANRVIFTNFLNAHPLTRPHPHAVRHKVIIISNCRLVPFFESAGLKLGRTFLLRTHRLAWWALNQLSYQDRL